ncbi:hypothetical protein F511_18365 [Dorcoceras hygrometricum]|uniref:Uncharacterized protein n=1 Tax=Dorcoceras hygrometricum TaxID=472368 RepID=A0A2Z7C2D8_9LAMI|nr:hypothetical protein F511_18365 [Dorcoceras hygrometricum]
MLEHKHINICNTSIKHNKHTQSSTRTTTKHGNPTHPSRNSSKPNSTLNYKLKIRTLIPSTITTIKGPEKSEFQPFETHRAIFSRDTNTQKARWELHTQPATDSNKTTNNKLKQGLILRSQQQFEVLPQRRNTRPKTATSRSSLANNSLQEWYRKEELLKRSPTLPRTYQTTVGNDENSPEKLTVNSTRVQETKVDNRGKLLSMGSGISIRRPSLP